MSRALRILSLCESRENLPALLDRYFEGLYDFLHKKLLDELEQRKNEEGEEKCSSCDSAPSSFGTDPEESKAQEVCSVESIVVEMLDGFQKDFFRRMRGLQDALVREFKSDE